MSSTKSIRRVLTVIFAVSLLGLFFVYYALILHKGIDACLKEEYFYVRLNDGRKELFQNIESKSDFITSISLPLVVKLIRFSDQNVKNGRYQWTRPISALGFLRLIRSGQQEPLNFVLFHGESIEDMAGMAGRFFEQDSLSYLYYFLDPSIARSYGYNSDDFLTMFIPNTYEMYWNTTPESFVKRMHREHQNFWNLDRKDAIDKNNLDTRSAYILASIVEKESLLPKERARIAGVYLNRLKKGMLLQADPTVVYALGEKGLRRVLNKHLEINSPYNTYLYPGLPPGPISMPSQGSLEASIHPEKHSYYFFCAKPGFNGAHAFAKTLAGHNLNAKIYRNWLNREGIMK
jgi:UPF0755 protein